MGLKSEVIITKGFWVGAIGRCTGEKASTGEIKIIIRTVPYGLISIWESEENFRIKKKKRRHYGKEKRI